MLLQPKSKKRKWTTSLMLEESLLERMARVEKLAESRGLDFNVEKDLEKHLAAQITRAENALAGEAGE